VKVCVLGLGYIGLPSAVLFATHGQDVVGVDINRDIVSLVSRGLTPFEEPGLAELLQQAIHNKKLVARTQVEDADVFFIAVPTPLDRDTKMAELKYLNTAAQSIYPHLKQDSLVILESTVPPGTCHKLLIPILERSKLKAGRDFHVAHCPERAMPKSTLHEMVHNDRIIGGVNERSAEMAKKLYSSFVRGSFYLTSLRTAEFVKVMENTFRDINIALANEFAQIAEECGVNVWEAIELANKHPRVSILKPGPGVGGHCIAIDPWFLTGNSTRCRIVSLARQINESMPNHVLEIVRELVGALDSPIITVLGVAYKGGVDDTRETPALKLIKLAMNEGYTVRVHDPRVKQFEYELLGLEQAVKGSDCIVLITDHPEFKQINPAELGGLMRSRNVVDTRNVLDHEEWKNAGFGVRLLGTGITEH